MTQRIETTFALIADYQYIENYAFTEDGCADGENPYWKYKGGTEEIVVEGITLMEAQQLTDESTLKLVELESPVGLGERSDYCIHQYLGCTLEARDEHTIEAVLNLVKSQDVVEYGYTRYCAPADAGVSEAGFDWAMNILRDRGLVSFTLQYSWDNAYVDVLEASDESYRGEKYDEYDI